MPKLLDQRTIYLNCDFCLISQMPGTTIHFLNSQNIQVKYLFLLDRDFILQRPEMFPDYIIRWISKRQSSFNLFINVTVWYPYNILLNLNSYWGGRLYVNDLLWNSLRTHTLKLNSNFENFVGWSWKKLTFLHASFAILKLKMPNVYQTGD